MKKSILCVLASALILTVCAQPPEDSAKRGCTDPPGYSDTPLIPGQTWKVHDISHRVSRRRWPPPQPAETILTTFVLAP